MCFYTLLTVSVVAFFSTRVNSISVSPTHWRPAPSLAIVGVVKDAADWIADVLLDAASFCDVAVNDKKVLAECKVFVHESHSTDNTRAVIADLAQTKVKEAVNLNLVPIIEPPVAAHKSRSERIADARNVLLRYLRELHRNETFSFTHAAVMDMDGAFGMRPADNILEVFNTRKGTLVHLEWDVISFNADIYYDLWALRCDYDGKADNCNQENTCQKCFYDSCFFDKLKNKDSAVSVRSAFNGIAIYKAKVYHGTPEGSDVCEYSGIGEDDSAPDCEHVSFHRCLREKYNAGIYVVGLSIELNETRGGEMLQKHRTYTSRKDGCGEAIRQWKKPLEIGTFYGLYTS